MRNIEKNVVWSNENICLDDWKDYLAEEYPEVVSEDEQYDLVCRLNDEYLEDERANFDSVPDLDRDIIVIADLGLWNGRRKGYAEIGNKLSRCLSTSCDYATWYVDENGDLRCDASHHDGTNHYLYRTYKKSATDDDIEDLKDKIYNNVVTEEDIDKVTERLGDKVCRIYGWKIKKAG